MKSRNIYTEQLKFTTNEQDVQKCELIFKTQLGTTFANITIEICYINTDGEKFYSITSASGQGDLLTKKIDRRISGDSATQLTSELLDKKLEGLQYWIRKHIVEFNKIEAVEVEAVEVEAVETTEEAPAKPITTPEAVQAAREKFKAQKITTPKVGLEKTIFDLVESGMKSEDAANYIAESVKSELDALGVVPGKVDLIIHENLSEPVNVGMQHEKFPTVLMSLKAGVNVALVGPAGSGKTTIVKSCAEACKLPFYSKSVSAQTGSHEFFGYQDANGQYVRTLFREAYENGGIFLLDEFDAGNPNVLAALNQATANHSCAFADGMIDKHDDFMVVMAGNTFGHGATSEYVGRNKIDAATLDRFAFIYLPYDETFEMNLSTNKKWCEKVQAIRALVATKKIKTIVSPRATFDGSKLLAVGMAESEVMELLIYKGLNSDERALLKI
jgi:hypothetical protein